ncbi:cytochrome c [Kordiimonas sp. SCSIO 12610]|uniref:c-type cytochrome n=1 Tax=Kordiimonas sp. SCSIO 12610 TaxID=2829597 RepID=UPI00210C61D5|nr:cytochrome c [Kordiimonas sp. SCSIO 12610]UTW55323.1 cytochrome c [Kordiimonas sp. SCSIO 12610]
MNSRKVKMVTAACALSIGIAFTGNAIAADKKERSPASQYRHDVMEVVKYSAANIGQILRKTATPEEGDLAGYAEILANAAALSKSAFKPDTRGQDGFTEAKDDIWANWDDFAGRMDKFANDTRAFADAAKSGDQAKIGATVGEVFKNCKSCHDKYQD